MAKKAIAPVPKKRMDVRKEHKIELKIEKPFVTLEKKYPDKSIALVGKNFTVANMKYLEGGKLKTKRVMVKEIDFNKIYVDSHGERSKSVIQHIKESLVLNKIKPTKKNMAKAYNEVIIKLRDAGIPLPKMKAIVLDDKLLLVSQYFGKKTPNRFSSKLIRDYPVSFLKNEKHNELLDLYAKTINAGIVPTVDFIEKLNMKKGKVGYLPFDVDQQVMFYFKYGDIRKLNKDRVDLQSNVFMNLSWPLGKVILKDSSKEESIRKFNYLRKRIDVPWISKMFNSYGKNYWDL
jgi:hypothetical protein